jgi:hypothetical protein
MTSHTGTARLAGGLYLLSAVVAGVPLIYVPGNLIVEGDAAATAGKILAWETLFRACMVSELAGSLLLIGLVATLSQLLATGGRLQARLMVVLALLSVPITFVNILNESAALYLVHGAANIAAINRPDRQALAMLFLDLHGDGVSLANIFWGLWLLPFGILVLRTGALPRILGAWLIADCFGLVLVSVTALLSPAYLDIVSRIALVPELGELGAMIWLLVMGARTQEMPHASAKSDFL